MESPMEEIQKNRKAEIQKGESPLYVKSLDFAERILDMSDYLLSRNPEVQKSRNTEITYGLEVCVKQVTRSGTSIVANVSEGNEAQSKADLASKNGIALKEARETKTWLTLMHRKKYITDQQYESMLADLTEILKMLGSSIRTLRK